MHRQRTPEEQTLVGMLEAVFAVMEEPKGESAQWRITGRLSLLWTLSDHAWIKEGVLISEVVLYVSLCSWGNRM